MDDLFDVFNPQPIDTGTPEVAEPPAKKQKTEVDVDALLRKAWDIADGKVGVDYAKTVLRDVDNVVPFYEPALDLPYEPFDYQKASGVAIDVAYGIHTKVAPANVLVSSPTGSGKTFLIKHAAMRAHQTGQRLIVGVPLVALAEQTFAGLRALLKEDGAVGIRTGPSEKFPDAPILVCTYEIVCIQMSLHPEWLDECPVLILDEIHFMADKDRGCRVEAIAANLPPWTVLIGLSGTIPNANEFAHGMSRATDRPTRLVGLTKRPIQLRYYCHLGGKLTEICYNRPGTVEQRFKKKAWDYVMRQVEKRPDRLSHGQTRGRLLQLVRDLEREDKFPAMIVAFSCRMLDTLGKQLHSIDMLPENASKSYVHQQFRKMQKCVGEEEWPLFAPLMEMAKRGIGIHHSQNPKLYLELLPDLVRRGLVKMVFCTSTLSTGIDLPVRTVVLLSLIQPGKDGFRPVEPALLQQIMGRAGRPGQETEGNFVLTMWQRPDQRVDVLKLLFAPSSAVQGNGMVQPREVLAGRLFRRTPEDLLLSPFSSADTSHVVPVLNEVRAYCDTIPDEAAAAVDKLEECRSLAGKAWRALDAMVLRARKGDRIVVDSGTVRPEVWTVTGTRPLRAKEHEGKVPNAWVFDCRPCRAKKPSMDDAVALNRLRELLPDLEKSPDVDPKAAEAVTARRCLAQMVSVEGHPLWPTYKALVDRLKAYDFLDKDGLVTYKGKMVPGIMGCDDVLTLVEAWTKNLLPRDSEASFAAALTCFLQNRRHNQPDDETGVYARLCALQKHIGDEEELGTNMMEPVRLWVEGHYVHQICSACDASPGPVCKTVQRLVELLGQMEEAAGRVNDDTLADLCDRTVRKVRRGLPFVESMYLR